MSITSLFDLNNDYVFKALSVGSQSPYVTVGFNSLLSNKYIVILYDSINNISIYQKEVDKLNKSSLSTSKLIGEYIELMQNWV